MNKLDEIKKILTQAGENGANLGCVNCVERLANQIDDIPEDKEEKI